MCLKQFCRVDEFLEYIVYKLQTFISIMFEIMLNLGKYYYFFNQQILFSTSLCKTHKTRG
jgi:hypothetical protein